VFNMSLHEIITSCHGGCAFYHIKVEKCSPLRQEDVKYSQMPT